MDGKLPVKLLLFCVHTVEGEFRAQLQICVMPESCPCFTQGLASCQVWLTIIRFMRLMWLLNHTGGMVPVRELSVRSRCCSEVRRAILGGSEPARAWTATPHQLEARWLAPLPGDTSSACHALTRPHLQVTSTERSRKGRADTSANSRSNKACKALTSGRTWKHNDVECRESAPDAIVIHKRASELYLHTDAVQADDAEGRGAWNCLGGVLGYQEGVHVVWPTTDNPCATPRIVMVRA